MPRPEPLCFNTDAPIDVDVAAIFDPFGNAVHSALSFPVLGEDVLVTGAGPIGLAALLTAQFYSPGVIGRGFH